VARTDGNNAGTEKIMRKIVIPALIVASGAQAGGWIADNIIKPVFGEHAAREADKLHERLGKPLDQAAEAAATAAAAGALGGGHR
jgi:hypothetical protein